MGEMRPPTAAGLDERALPFSSKSPLCKFSESEFGDMGGQGASCRLTGLGGRSEVVEWTGVLGF